MAAVTAAERGHDVTVWEADDKIGGQLNLAVVAPGKQEMTQWMVHLNYRAKKAGVKFEFNNGRRCQGAGAGSGDRCHRRETAGSSD